MDPGKRIVPPLRSDVELVEEDGHERLPFAAIDRALGQKIRLEPVGMAVASSLSKAQPAGQLLLTLRDDQGLRRVGQ